MELERSAEQILPGSEGVGERVEAGGKREKCPKLCMPICKCE
jgi:hypothetical protein